MSEFLHICLAPLNLPITVMLGSVIGYWTLFLVGAVGLDLFDSDVDLDMDADLDVDVAMDASAELDVSPEVDTDLHVDTGADAVDAVDQVGIGDGFGSWWVAILRFFNVGDVPVVVLVSSFVGCLWALTVLTTHYTNPDIRLSIWAMWFLPNVVLSLFATKLTTSPFRFLFRQANMGIAKPTRFVGSTCIVTTSSATEKSGQARIDPRHGGAPIMLNVRTRPGAVIRQGEEAVIVDHDADKRIFVVAPFELGG